MNINIYESSDEELLEIIKNRQMYSEETIHAALTLLNERRNLSSGIELKYRNFGRNKSLKGFLYVQVILMFLYGIKILMAGMTIFDTAILLCASSRLFAGR